jgi:GAF domain-containing protein
MSSRYEPHHAHSVPRSVPGRDWNPAGAPSPLAEIVKSFERALEQQGLFGSLRYLNSTTEYRFTGIYRFESTWVRSILLFDRGNSHLQVGKDVPLQESYCMLTAQGGDSYCIEDARADSRLCGHAARESVLSYYAVHLVDPEGRSWGTLCHFDFVPRRVTDEMKQGLEAVRPAIQQALWVEVGV